jgi:hypothetical protein
MYLVKTKKATVVNGKLKLNTGEFYEDYVNSQKDLELEYEDELLLVLEFIVISQMMAEPMTNGL